MAKRTKQSAVPRPPVKFDTRLINLLEGMLRQAKAYEGTGSMKLFDHAKVLRGVFDEFDARLNGNADEEYQRKVVADVLAWVEAKLETEKERYEAPTEGDWEPGEEPQPKPTARGIELKRVASQLRELLTAKGPRKA